MSKLTGILMTLLGLFLLAKPAQAGGWVVITLDALPGPIHAGETVHLGFMVRQHGVTPIDGVSPTLTAVNRGSGETITADAEQVGETGHFQVAVAFPEAGVWDWQISAAPFPQEVKFEAFTVLPALSGEATAPPAAAEPLPSNGLGSARAAPARLAEVSATPLPVSEPGAPPEEPPDACPVTQPPDPPFAPPEPYPRRPPGGDEFWYGSEALTFVAWVAPQE